MTGLLASGSCTIRGIFYDKHQQTSFPSKNVLIISDNSNISAVIHLNLSMEMNKDHRTDLQQIARWWETPATCSHMQQDSCWVWRTSWLQLIPFLHEVHYILLRTSHFLLLSSSSPIPFHQVMDTRTPQPGGDGYEASRSIGASFHWSLLGTQQDCRH